MSRPGFCTVGVLAGNASNHVLKSFSGTTLMIASMAECNTPQYEEQKILYSPGSWGINQTKFGLPGTTSCFILKLGINIPWMTSSDFNVSLMGLLTGTYSVSDCLFPGYSKDHFHILAV